MAERPLSFDPCFGRLGRDLARFANHTDRQLRASQRHREALREAEAWSDGQAPLAVTPEDAAAAMGAVDKFARMRRMDRSTLVGAYFAHHHLRCQAELSRQLLAASLAHVDRPIACRAALRRAELERQRWVGALLDLTINAAAPDLSRDGYAAFNVGALTDHEDVDLAIVAGSPAALAALSRAFSVVSKTFVRFASKIQLFLAEQLATGHAGALLEEYEAFVARRSPHVVIATQLLGAQQLSGAPHLARALSERVSDRFYAGQGSPIVHEGFLRAVMGELAHLLAPGSLRGPLAPKQEIYVPSKLVVAAARVIHGVREPSPDRALAALAERDPTNSDAYRRLADAFVQNEVLRALIFLYVAKSDELDLADEAGRAASRRVALLLGLGRSRRSSAEQRLLSTYNALRAQALQSIAVLSLEIARHLGHVSSFRALVEHGASVEPGDDLAGRLLEALEHNPRGVFWEEIVELVGSSRETTARFLASVKARPRAERARIARRYVALMSEDAGSLVELLVLLASLEHEGPSQTGAKSLEVSATGELGEGVARLFFEALLEQVEEEQGSLRELVSRLDQEARSEALHRLASAYPPSYLSRLADLTEAWAETAEAAEGAAARRVARTLRSVIVLVHHSSHALGRIAARVVGRTPEVLHRLADPRRLKELAGDLLGQAARERTPRAHMELLGDAFDVSTLRAALLAILEADPRARDLELTQAVDRYVGDLVKAAFREVQARSPGFERARPDTGWVVYVTGGFARYEGFGADWDYLALVADGEPATFFGKVLQQVSSALARRGLLPHNRMTAPFNAYAVELSALERYLAVRTPETFIDEAEVLEARFLLGDPELHRGFHERVWGALVGERRALFMRDVLGELVDRRHRPPLGLNLKLGRGGLREIHLASILVRLHAGLSGPLVPALLPEAIGALPSLAEDLHALSAANDELRRARDLYRLVVATDDTMEPERIVRIAADLAPLRRAGIDDGYGRSLKSLMADVAQRVDRVSSAIGRVLTP